jgi:hypothetical protein
LQNYTKVVISNLYYMERRQSKTFLTQIGPTLLLTPDPPVRLCDDQNGGTTIEIAIWERFCKNEFFSPTPRVPTVHVPTDISVGTHVHPTVCHRPCAWRPNQLRRGFRVPSFQISERDRSGDGHHLDSCLRRLINGLLCVRR